MEIFPIFQHKVEGTPHFAHVSEVRHMYVGDVKDVEDRSNTPKGCNAMYVEDVGDGKRTYTHILAHNFLNT